ncbi:MAG TPA: GntR family transcriptional regulator, partial [Candidatus Acidoferrum sp.]|nr:GntR family transcriptional regulator [Candidatus Acidoferrum sp.]
MDFRPKLDPASESPLYRQLYEQIAEQIRSGHLGRGERLPATRELAGQLGLNRTTVSAAYELLETGGLIAGQVGRGSFVTGGAPARVDWTTVLDRADNPGGAAPSNRNPDVISFAVSRPSRELFPLDAFRTSTRAVLERDDLAD